MLGLGALLGGQSVAFTLAFGTQGYAWRSVGHATMSLYHLVLGTHPSADPFALRHTNWVLGPLLYAFVVLLFYLVLLRFFLAIVQVRAQPPSASGRVTLVLCGGVCESRE